MSWRMEKMCDRCPFAKSGKGLALRKSLRPGRWAEIIGSLRRDNSFPCHKTTHETGDGSELMCAGAIEWQDRHTGPGQLQRIMQRLDHVKTRS